MWEVPTPPLLLLKSFSNILLPDDVWECTGVVTHILSLGLDENELKNCVFWDIAPFGSCKNRRFGET
jgi:hypothetical protein